MFCALLLLPGVLGTALAGPISGPEECAKGSVVWCRDLQVATRCGAVGHCRSTVWSQPTAKTLPCDVCLDVTALGHWLESNSTQAIIIHALDRLCSALPAPLVRECVTLVDRHGAFCNGCRRLLDLSARNLEQRSTRQVLLRTFKGGCSILPLTYMTQCNRFVTEYQPLFIETLRDILDPMTLCTKMGACHRPRTALLGTDQCVMGPSFWCESPETAEMCNAVEHCQRHVWKVSPFHT
uniref:Saposin B-type domain-containing protein n=1 Tax=Sus scrofa TaxID=9823 RepID=A0A4X1SP84_PIG